MPYMDDAKADAALAFMQGLKHVKGELAGQYIEYEPDQVDIIRELFGSMDDDGYRIYRKAYISVPRKWGKTTFVAALELCILFTDHEAGAEIYNVANEKDQAYIAVKIASQMIKQSPILKSISKIFHSTHTITFPAEDSFIRALTAEAETKDGLNPLLVVYDELHAAPNRRLYDVMDSAMGARRQPLYIFITTAGSDQSSICYEEYCYAKKVLNGEVEDPHYFAYICEADPDDDWKSREVWQKANPHLGVSVYWTYYEQQFKAAVNTPSKQNTFRRLYLNQWVKQVTRWLDMDCWNLNKGNVIPPDLSKQSCYGGMDLSTTTDITCVAFAFPQDDGTYIIKPKFWIPEDTMDAHSDRDHVQYDAWVRDEFIELTPGAVTDYSYIREYIRECCETYNVCEIAYDRWNASQLVQELDDDGITMIPFGQGFQSMSPASKNLESLLLQHKIQHNDDPVLKWMAGNVAITSDAAGNIKPVKDKSSGRIDGIIAMIMALDRAVRNDNGKSTYETEDLMIL